MMGRHVEHARVSGAAVCTHTDMHTQDDDVERMASAVRYRSLVVAAEKGRRLV